MKIFVILSLIALASFTCAKSGFGETDAKTNYFEENGLLRECQNSDIFSQSMCYAMYSLSISFYNKQLRLKMDIDGINKEKFCPTLIKLIPDKPDFEKLKDLFQYLPCNELCFYKKSLLGDDELVLLPSCGYLYNQLSVLYPDILQNNDENESNLL